MKNDKLIQYNSGFKFSFVLPLNEAYRYEIDIKTTGLTQYKAAFEYVKRNWLCHHCDVHGNEVTVYVRDHSLMPGKLLCLVHVFHGHHEVDTFGIDPHITLTADYTSGAHCTNDVDVQQSIDIVRLYDKVFQLGERIKILEGGSASKLEIVDEDGNTIEKMYVTTEDEIEAPVYTKAQCHEKFLTKAEMEKYAKLDVIIPILSDKVDSSVLQEDYYNKSVSDNRYAQVQYTYTKTEVDKLISALTKRIEDLEKSN